MGKLPLGFYFMKIIVYYIILYGNHYYQYSYNYSNSSILLISLIHHDQK